MAGFVCSWVWMLSNLQTKWLSIIIDGRSPNNKTTYMSVKVGGLVWSTIFQCTPKYIDIMLFSETHFLSTSFLSRSFTTSLSPLLFCMNSVWWYTVEVLPGFGCALTSLTSCLKHQYNKYLREWSNVRLLNKEKLKWSSFQIFRYVWSKFKLQKMQCQNVLK